MGYEFDDVFLHASDGTRLHAWWIKPNGDSRGIVYFLHGNAQNISTHYHSVLWLVDAGYQVLAIDYRGFGLSDGQPDVPDVFDDIHAGVQWLKPMAMNGGGPSLPVILYGQSLGASLAIKYLDLYNEEVQYFDGLIAESGFARYGSMARHVANGHWLTWLFQYPADWVMNGDYDAVDAIAQLASLPVLLVHSEEDAIVPFHNVEQLFGQAHQPKTLVRIQGPHIGSSRSDLAKAEMLKFIQTESADWQ